MKKKKEEAAPEEAVEEKVPEQMQQSAAQAIQAYFTKAVNDAVHEMTNDVMFSLLRNLEATEYWTAILRYNNLRLLNSQSALNTLDPVANPSAISRQQGAMMGLVDLQNAIIQMVEIEKAAAKEAQEIKDSLG